MSTSELDPLPTDEHPDNRSRTKQIAREIADELKSHPDHWFQGALVKFANGASSSTEFGVRTEDAVCWCLEGHICKRVDRDVSFWALDDFRKLAGVGTLFRWNDAPDRTVNDVIALCEKVAAS